MGIASDPCTLTGTGSSSVNGMAAGTAVSVTTSPATGVDQVAESVVYTLACQNVTPNAMVTVNYTTSTLAASFGSQSGSAIIVPVGSTVNLTWTETGIPADPCTLQGTGSSSVNGMPAGTVVALTSSPATGIDSVSEIVSFTLTCPGVTPNAVATVWYSASMSPSAYQYNGKAFNCVSDGFTSTPVCAGSMVTPSTSYTAADQVTAILTSPAPLPANLSYQDVSRFPGIQLSLYDGQKTLLEPAATSTQVYAFVSTDSLGNIVAPWNVFIHVDGPNSANAYTNLQIGSTSAFGTV